MKERRVRYIVWNKTLNIDATWERKFDACGGFSGDPRFPKKNLSFAHAPYRRPGRKGGLKGEGDELAYSFRFETNSHMVITGDVHWC